jgi:hypothetical protein
MGRGTDCFVSSDAEKTIFKIVLGLLTFIYSVIATVLVKKIENMPK